MVAGMSGGRAVRDVYVLDRAGQAPDVPAGYKRTEVGVIPEDWGVSTVGAEFRIQLGKMLDAAKTPEYRSPTSAIALFNGVGLIWLISTRFR